MRRWTVVGVVLAWTAAAQPLSAADFIHQRWSDLDRATFETVVTGADGALETAGRTRSTTVRSRVLEARLPSQASGGFSLSDSDTDGRRIIVRIPGATSVVQVAHGLADYGLVTPGVLMVVGGGLERVRFVFIGREAPAVVRLEIDVPAGSHLAAVDETHVDVDGTGLRFAAISATLALDGGALLVQVPAGESSLDVEVHAARVVEVPVAEASPPDVSGHVAVYDPVHQRVVRVGGRPASAGTWELDELEWTHRDVPSPGFFRSAMVWDAARERVVLFGGADEQDVPHAETWEYDGTAWTQRTPAHSPPARLAHGMVFDPRRGVTVLYGGNRLVAGQDVLDDTWEYDGTDWRQVVTASAPPARDAMALAWDGVRQEVLLFGGYDVSAVRGDTWSFDGQRWLELTPATSPGARSSAAMVWSADAGVAVLNGGLGATAEFEWTGTDWRATSACCNAVARHVLVDTPFGFLSLGGEAGGSPQATRIRAGEWASWVPPSRWPQSAPYFDPEANEFRAWNRVNAFGWRASAWEALGRHGMPPGDQATAARPGTIVPLPGGARLVGSHPEVLVGMPDGGWVTKREALVLALGYGPERGSAVYVAADPASTAAPQVSEWEPQQARWQSFGTIDPNVVAVADDVYRIEREASDGSTRLRVVRSTLSGLLVAASDQLVLPGTSAFVSEPLGVDEPRGVVLMTVSTSSGELTYEWNGSVWRQLGLLGATGVGPGPHGRWLGVSRHDGLLVTTEYDQPRDQGARCGDHLQCASGFCIDGRCCESACSSATDDCEACSVAAGGERDGQCTALRADVVVECAPAPNACSLPSRCVAGETACPAAQAVTPCSEPDAGVTPEPAPRGCGCSEVPAPLAALWAALVVARRRGRARASKRSA